MTIDLPTIPVVDTDPAEVAVLAAAAARAVPALRSMPLPRRAAMLRGIADAIDAQLDRLVEVAVVETHLPAERLRGEVARTTGQLRLFADAVEEGSYLEATIDHAVPDATPPRPEVRRILQSIGPVAVFTASNFPFAFSVAGGDTASALAAGCPVIVKLHDAHPLLSTVTARIIEHALDAAGAPAGTFAMVRGRGAATALVTHPEVKAVGFTGSQHGGRALFDLAVSRPDPIPFYGELGSVNAAVVTAEAAATRTDSIASGLAASFTLGVGQFCTKPGLVLAPVGSGIVDAVAAAVRGKDAATMLTPRIAEGFHTAVAEVSSAPGVEVVVAPAETPAEGDAGATVLSATAADVLASPDVVLQEMFGPACLVVEYENEAQLLEVLTTLPPSLAIAIHAEPDENPELLAALLEIASARAGRVVWNSWPTGVAVTWSMHHGGSWPATTASIHTSVGATATRRFLSPVAYQDCPPQLLPAELRDDNPFGIVRRVDGALSLR